MPVSVHAHIPRTDAIPPRSTPAPLSRTPSEDSFERPTRRVFSNRCGAATLRRLGVQVDCGGFADKCLCAFKDIGVFCAIFALPSILLGITFWPLSLMDVVYFVLLDTFRGRNSGIRS